MVFYSEVLKWKKTDLSFWKGWVTYKGILSKDKLCSTLKHLFLFQNSGNAETIVGSIILDANCNAEKN